MKARRYIVFGRVQCVGFRWYTRRHALALEISGWVRNRHDGSVEVWAEGPEAVLDEFESRLQTGPQGASVREVQSEDVAMAKAYRGFDITY